jgi:hypothetical protein
MGQTNVLGAYPFHFHLLGNVVNNHSYIKGSSVFNSFYRGVLNLSFGSLGGSCCSFNLATDGPDHMLHPASKYKQNQSHTAMLQDISIYLMWIDDRGCHLLFLMDAVRFVVDHDVMGQFSAQLPC